MKKNLFWMLTAFTMCGMVMTACSDDDKTSGQKTDETTEIVDFPEKPTTDLLETQIKRPAYVFRCPIYWRGQGCSGTRH